MEYTISTHNGSAVRRQHNIRNRKITNKEKHIHLDGHHETWLDIRPIDAYHQLFDESVNEYNNKQQAAGHPERTIHNYYHKICSDSKKHPVYEMIVGIGNYNNHPPEEISKKILRKFYESWNDRNPNLYLIGAYYHADEDGIIHVHLDYVCVAHNCTRGPSTQSALVKALNEQGLYTDNIHDTAQIKFERLQNQYLEELCKEEGLNIIHPRIEHSEHIQTSEYKSRIKNEALNQNNTKLEERINNLIEHHNHLVDDIQSLSHYRQELGIRTR